jgi:hypothetical protein
MHGLLVAGIAMNAHSDSRNLAALEPDFRAAVEKLLAACDQRGAILKPFFTVRGPGVQAKLWCQSRTAAQISAQKSALTQAGAGWLAGLLDVRWAGTGPQVTNALPGLSWHQWGEAIDCYVEGERKEAIWNVRHAGYRIYAEEAKRLGLEAGALWTRFPDAVHVQWRAEGSPLRTGMSWAQIDAAMRKKFSS